jgi:hypothetical protein
MRDDVRAEEGGSVATNHEHTSRLSTRNRFQQLAPKATNFWTPWQVEQAKRVLSARQSRVCQSKCLSIQPRAFHGVVNAMKDNDDDLPPKRSKIKKRCNTG